MIFARFHSPRYHLPLPDILVAVPRHTARRYLSYVGWTVGAAAQRSRIGRGAITLLIGILSRAVSHRHHIVYVNLDRGSLLNQTHTDHKPIASVFL